MEQNTQVQSDTTQEPVVQETKQEQTYTAEQLSKRLSEVNAEAKKYRLSNAELKKKLEEAERTKLQESGNFKELADKFQAEAEHHKALSHKLKSAFATKTVSDQVSLEATKLGCVDPEVVLSIIDLDSIAVDDSFKVDQASVKSTLEQIRLNKPYLFKKETPKFNDVTPSGKIQVKPQKALNELSAKEIEAMLLKNYK